MATIDIGFLQRRLLSVLLFCIAIESALSISNHSSVPSTCTSQPRVNMDPDTGNTILGGIEEDILSSNIQEFLKSNHSHLDHSHSSHSLSNHHINTSGIYLLNESVPFNGRILRIRAYGYFSDENILWDTYRNTNNTDIYSFLFVVVYRINEKSSAYDLIHGPARISHDTMSPGSLPTSSNMDQTLDWSIEYGDKIGVFLPEDCVTGSDGNLMCPSHINLVVGSESCLSAEYRSGGGSLADLDDVRIDSFEEVQLMLNLEVTIAGLPVESMNNNGVFIAIGVVVIVLLVVLLLVSVVVIIYCILQRINSRRISTTDLHNKQSCEREAMYNSMQKVMSPNYEYIIDDRVAFQRGEMVIDGYTLLAKEEGYYNVKTEQHVVKTTKTEDTDYDYQEPYFEPANVEEELIMQLSTKLVIPEIPQENLQICEILGSGAFGMVHRGLWHHSEGGESVEEEVAVKSMEGNVTEEDRVKFLQEATIMAQFKHFNIVRIRGIITDPPMMLVVDIMKGGDLRQHLLNNVRKSLESIDPQELISTLLSYIRQIALGMSYLTNKCYVHRDLAARNILVNEDGSVCKIADFGLSRELQNENFYVSHGGRIPVKWTAPEAIHYRKYSTASDVWSYGCVVYEIWSLGEKPFHDMTNSEAMKHVMSGHRLPPPPGCPRVVYHIMIKCWHPIVEKRLTFCEIIQQLQKSDYHILKWTAEDIKKYNQEARSVGSPLECSQELYKDLQQTYIVIKKETAILT